MLPRCSAPIPAPVSLTSTVDGGPTPPAGQADAPAVVRELHRIVEEIEEEPDELIRVRAQAEVRLDVLDQQLAPRLGERADLIGDGREQPAQIDLLQARREGAAVEAREQEQILGQPGEPGDLGLQDPQGVLVLRAAARPGEGHLDAAAEGGERRAQLVGHVGHEAPLPLERLVQPLEHAIEGGRQPAELLRALGTHAAAQVAARDLLRGGGHVVDGGERPPGQEQAADRGEHQHEGQPEQQLPAQAREGRLGRRQGAASL